MLGIAHAHPCSLGPRVTGHVRQRLLHDPVGGEVDIGRQRPRLTVDPHVDVEARGGRPGDQVGQPLEARGGAPGRPLVDLAQDPEHRTDLTERLGGRVVDHRQRGPSLLGSLVEQVQRHPGLHVDQRDVVGQHVVQVTGDPQPLLLGAPQSLLFAAATHGGDPLAARAHRLAGEQQHQQPRGQAGRLSSRRPPAGPDRPWQTQEHDPAGRDTHERHDPIAAADHEPKGDDQRQEDRPRGIADQRIGGGGSEHDCQHPARIRPFGQERERPDAQQHVGAPVQRVDRGRPPPRPGVRAGGMAGDRMRAQQLHGQDDGAQQQIALLSLPADGEHLVAALWVAHALTITRISAPVVGRRE